MSDIMEIYLVESLQNPIFDELKERQLFEDSMIEASEEAGFGEPDLYRDSGGCYRQAYHQAAWGGWLASAKSREVIEVELPQRIEFSENGGDYFDGARNGYNQCIDTFARCLKLAGLKVKP